MCKTFSAGNASRPPLVDQAAFHGVFACLRDLGIPLIELTQAEADEPPSE